MAPISQHLIFMFLPKILRSPWRMSCSQPNRSSRGNSDQYGRSNFTQNLKHAPSPTVTMSTMLSALKIIIHSGIWLAQRRDLKWHADINKVG